MHSLYLRLPTIAMAGWHLPGDPYFPAMNGGWLNEPAPPVTAPADVIDLASDTEDEGPILGEDMDTEVIPPTDEDEESSVGNDEQAEDEETSEEEEPTEEEEHEDERMEEHVEEHPAPRIQEVRRPRVVLRSLYEARPEPGFQTYRHPGGPLWKYTPRKRVLPVRCTNPLLTLSPSQGPGPQWVKDVRAWGREQDQTPPRLRLSPASASNPVYQTLSVTVRRIVRMDEQVRAHTSQIYDVGASAHASAARLHQVEEDHSHTRSRVDTLEQDVITTRAESRDHLATIDALRHQVQETARQVQEARAEIRELRALLASSSGTTREVIMLD